MKNKSNIAKVALTVGLLVGTGAAAFGVTSVANAATSSQGKAAKILKKKAAKKTTASNKSTASAQAVTSTTVLQTTTGNASSMEHRGGPVNLDNVANVLGITAAELRTELQTKSFATVASEKNVDIQKVKDQLLKDYTDKEQAEVAEGKHTQAEVDAKIAAFKTKLDTIVNTVRPAHGPGMGKGGPGGKIASEGVAKALGLTTTELQTQLQSGKTLADIAKDSNVDIQKVKDAITADVKAHLDEEVASGEHTQAEADAKLAELKTRLDDIVNGVRPAGGPGMGGRGHHGGRGGRGGHGHGMGGENGMRSMSGTSQPSTQGASFSA